MGIPIAILSSVFMAGMQIPMALIYFIKSNQNIAKVMNEQKKQ